MSGQSKSRVACEWISLAGALFARRIEAIGLPARVQREEIKVNSSYPCLVPDPLVSRFRDGR